MYLQRAQQSRLRTQWRFRCKQLKQLIMQEKFQQLAPVKKAILLNKLRQLFKQILRFEKVSRLKKALGIAALVLGLQASPLQAQVEFANTVSNPFGLTPDFSQSGLPNLADIDNDGDLDLITLNNSTTPRSLSLWKNISTNNGTLPHFAEPPPNFGGIILPEIRYENLEFGDIDNDGDLDLMIGTSVDPIFTDDEAQLYFFENIGTPSAPAYAEPVTNPFNIDIGTSIQTKPILIDLDADGDLDIIDHFRFPDFSASFQYFENIGTVEPPDFAPRQLSPFGLNENASEYKLLDFGDLDNDGDIDLITGRMYIPYNYNGFGTTKYVENIGTPENPQFTTPIVGPSANEFSMGYEVWPILGDLDNDGDLDILGSLYYDYGINDSYWPYRENLSDPLAVKEPTLAAEATVFPSVSQNIVTIQVETETSQPYFQLNVLNIQGQLLHQQQLAGGKLIEHQIDLSNYPTGQYLIQVRTPEGVLVRKVIRQ